MSQVDEQSGPKERPKVSIMTSEEKFSYDGSGIIKRGENTYPVMKGHLIIAEIEGHKILQCHSNKDNCGILTLDYDGKPRTLPVINGNLITEIPGHEIPQNPEDMSFEGKILRIKAEPVWLSFTYEQIQELLATKSATTAKRDKEVTETTGKITDNTGESIAEILPLNSTAETNARQDLLRVLHNRETTLSEQDPGPTLHGSSPANPKVEKKPSPSGWTEEGDFDPETGDLIKGKRTYPSGWTWEGEFDQVTGSLIKGEKTSPSGQTYEGKFDQVTGSLIKGEKTSPSGWTEEGEYDPVTEMLIKGKRTSPDGQTEEGEFDRVTGELIKGKPTINGEAIEKTEPDLPPDFKASVESIEPHESLPANPQVEKITSPFGQTYEGKFDQVTGRLIKGKETSPRGLTYEGEFDPETGRLIKGKPTINGEAIEKTEPDLPPDFKASVESIEPHESLPANPQVEKVTFPSGWTEEGEYDPVTEMLIKGKRTSPDGQTEEGEFDRVTGELIKGKVTFPSGLTYEGEFDPATRMLIKGKKTYPDGRTEEGDFDPATRMLIKGKRTSPDGQTEEGEFDQVTGELITGKPTINSEEIGKTEPDLPDFKASVESIESHESLPTKPKVEKKTFPDGRTEEGEFDQVTGYFINGKRTSPFGQTEEGEFDQVTGYFINGKRTSPNGWTYEGEFDPETGRLIKGKITSPFGQTEEGEFDQVTGYFINGKRTSPNGQTEEGDFNPATGSLIKGKKTYPDGLTYEGDFDPATRMLIKGKRTSPDGQTEEGEFDQVTGELITGKPTINSEEIGKTEPDLPDFKASVESIESHESLPTKPKVEKRTFPDGRTYEGEFDLATRYLIKGKRTYPDGQTEEGEFDPETGRLIKGKITSPFGQTYEGKFDQVTGYFINGKRTYPSGWTWEGEFDQATGDLIKGKVTFPDGDIVEKIKGKEILFLISITQKFVKYKIGMALKATGNLVNKLRKPKPNSAPAPSRKPSTPKTTQGFMRRNLGKLALGTALVAGGGFGASKIANKPKTVDVSENKTAPQPAEIPKGTVVVPTSIEEAVKNNQIIITPEGKKRPAPGWEWTHLDKSGFKKGDMNQYSVTKE